MRDRMKVPALCINDVDVGVDRNVILFAGIEGDPSSIGRPARSARVPTYIRKLHGMIAVSTVQPDLACTGTC
jgi:hypothetical protein